MENPELREQLFDLMQAEWGLKRDFLKNRFRSFLSCLVFEHYVKEKKSTVLLKAAKWFDKHGMI